MEPAIRIALNIALIGFLTILTQIGGLAWFAALLFRRRFLAFILLYATLWGVATLTAPLFGRVPLHCGGDGALRMHSTFYCVTARNFMKPEIRAALERVAKVVSQHHPGSIVQVLDANFPFLDGFPLLPHLSHDDGAKVDLALFYQEKDQSLDTRTPSPIGYFHFADVTSPCPKGAWATLRWNMRWLQTLWPDWQIDDIRTATLVRALSNEPAIGKILLEPYLVERMKLNHDKIRFQGCRAARHDDHIHLQL